ncbi:MAG: acetylornithine/succinylornithine family transaminase [Acidimicrobiia bacterium]
MTVTQASAWGTTGGHSPLMDNYGSPPRLFVKGLGPYIWDREGRQYLDFLGGLAVVALGHCHPTITRAVARQAGVLVHTSNLFANEHQAPVAEMINSLVDCGSGQVLFQNSGAEANEAAIKLARKHQGPERYVVLSALGSFHGRTLATLAATGQPAKHAPFAPMPDGFRHILFNDIAALESAMDADVAAVLLESVQGEGGVNPAAAGYLQAVRSLCDQEGVLLILDEIQTGMGRTGEWFGFQHAGIKPDVVTMAKALGNGFPVAAVWATDAVAAAFGPGDHGSTFAGQPVALSAARAAIDTYIEIDAPTLVREMGAYLAKRAEACVGVGQVRGQGLLLALELSPAALAGRTAKDIATACLDRGLIVNGVTPTALRLAPPYIVTKQQIDEAIDIISDAIASAPEEE